MTAREWVAGVQVGTSVRWRALEVAAFDAHPRMLAQLDPAGKYGGGKGRKGGPSRGFILAIPLIILIFAVYAAPIVGFTTLVGDRFGRSDPDPARTIPAAGIIFAIGLPFLLVSLALWLRSGRPRDMVGEFQAGTSLVLGALSTAIAVTLGTRETVPYWEAWIVPIVIVTVVGGVFSAMLLIARRSNPARAPRGDSGTSVSRVTAVEPLKRVREQVERLSDQERATIRRDIDAAIVDLAHRGVITDADADWARGAELGKLALRMSQGRGPVDPERDRGAEER